MRYITLLLFPAVLWGISPSLFGQEPATGMPGAKSGSEDSMSKAAISGSKQDPAAVERGGKVFQTNCAGCHGVAANGGPGAPDLVRSVLVLDDEKGILIAPVVREGRPDKGMPKLGLSEPQIADVVAWLHARTYAAGHRGTYIFQNVVTGNAQLGEEYFNTTGGCAKCHSVTGDLAGIGAKYDAFSLQSRWLEPRNSRSRTRNPANKAGDSASKMTPTVTIKLPNGQTVSGNLEQIDDFTIGLSDSQHQYHSFSRQEKDISIEIHDPVEAHSELLHRYTDADIHNVTAYLVSLK
ncbi:MAG TPA: c-type cytochrome [Bryobacteraceae bacterium]|nr:c-type cytochrome [Bryobacteraceae bacterium]